jgi:tetratricopeptide (TPR) repeat protein
MRRVNINRTGILIAIISILSASVLLTSCKGKDKAEKAPPLSEEHETEAKKSREVKATDSDKVANLKIAAGELHEEIDYYISTEGEGSRSKTHKGIYLLSKLEVEDAVKEFNLGIEANPFDGTAYKGLASVYSYQGQYDKAIVEYSKAIEAVPDDSHAYLRRGEAHLKLEHYEDVVNDYSKAIEINPRYVNAYKKRGIYYGRDLELYELALEDFEKVLELEPTDAETYLNRGNIYIKLDFDTDGIENFTKAIEIKPEYAQPYYNRGKILAYLKRYEEAIADFEKYIELAKEKEGAYVEKAKRLLAQAKAGLDKAGKSDE